MELLQQLEERVTALLARLEELTQENTRLKEAHTQELSTMTELNQLMQEELDVERSRKKTALTRVEALIERIKEQTEDR